MKKLNALMVLALSLQLLAAPGAHALVKMGPSGKTEIKGVLLTDSVKLEEAGTPLPRVTQGLRQKKVVLAWFSVYVAQFFTGSKVDLASIEKLKASLLAGLPVVVTMTFLRNVDNEKIHEGFEEVFTKTGVDIKKPAFANYLAAVKKIGDIKDRQVFTFVFSQAAGKETFSFQTNGSEQYTVTEAPGILSSFLNMWVGTPVKDEKGNMMELDSGLQQLQELVLKL